MNLSALIRQFRLAAQDRVEPYLTEDEDLTDLFNDAEREAAIRGRLIHEHQSPDICQIAVVADLSYYLLHRTLYEITHIRFVKAGDEIGTTVLLKSTEELDRIMPDWRDCSDTPKYAVQDDVGLRLVPMPSEAGTLHLEGYRLPLTDLQGDGDEPEINQAHHGYLHLWVLHKVFSMPDSELFDPDRAALAEMEFTRQFGIRPDSDLRRIVREDELHVVHPMLI